MLSEQPRKPKDSFIAENLYLILKDLLLCWILFSEACKIRLVGTMFGTLNVFCQLGVEMPLTDLSSNLV